ncbi:MAG: aminopeptidase P family protein [Alphaproteobacteria bacterium]
MTRSASAASACRDRYQGDEALARLLKKAGVTRGVAEIRALVAGAAAAPEAADPDAWLVLVAPDASPALAAQLKALKAELKAEAVARPEPSYPERLAALRAEMARRGLAGFLVPRTDEYQNEFIPPSAERLAWLTGFTGSAGLAAVLRDKAAIFVDGRYTLQVRDQVDTASFEPRHIVDEPPPGWLAANLPRGGKLGYDPWLHSPNEVARLQVACEKAGAVLTSVADSPVDAVWRNRPPIPVSPVVPHDLRFAGVASEEKRKSIAADLQSRGIAAVVLTAPDSIAWLFNIRGGDLPCMPAPLAFAVLDDMGAAQLFLDTRKLTATTRAHLGNAVSVAETADFPAALDALGGKRVLADPASASAFVFERLGTAKAEIVRDADPCQLPKACKNAAEIAGARAAHVRDGAALTGFLAWLDRAASSGTVTELEAVERLAQFRRGGENFRDFSFDTISGAGPNGAIVHYRATAASNRKLEPGSLYLVDSGAQYLDGTTDVTRTVFVPGGAEPTAEQKDRYTRVLKGHIVLALARFPAGTSGSQLDALARQPLWQAGLDYDHGTGHGVGSYLGVHEGPQRISKMPNTVALRAGMIVSNEPGYYKTGAYGIRIENLVVVGPAKKQDGAERETFSFETLTLAPIDLRLVEPSLLSPAEAAWLDAYHARVRVALEPLVDDGTRAWLVQATRPIAA